ncbi:MAG: sugar phosphate nucleotidyltransferase [Bryobacteraceae bacterium]|nr:sugar phosphate nucleotidyltransferase [Bryobacteraceae bacterium]
MVPPRNLHRHALILAGGRGTRFWPRSRRAAAKQVLDLTGEGPLIGLTVRRLRPLVDPSRIWVLTSRELRPAIVRLLRDVPPRQILAEPAGRNTAPAIGLAAKIMMDADPQAVMGVFPADHHIGRPAAFRRLAAAAWKEAARGRMVLLGIAPRWPETGYGYIEFPPDSLRPGSLEPAPVLRFREKPDLETAKRYVESGNYLWNAGIFFWPAALYLEHLRRCLPGTAERIESLPRFGSRAFFSKLEEIFPQCDNISVDYAVLEKTPGISGFAAGDIGWSDLGSFNAVYELLARDGAGNASRGELLALDARGNYADAPGKLVALVGVEDLIVVDTPDALLVARRDQAQRVGDGGKALEAKGRTDLL